MDFAKAKSSKTDFLTLQTRKTFIYLQKAFTKALILRHFVLKCYIHIKTDTLKYRIGRVFSQMTLGQLSSDYLTYESFDPNFKSEIGYRHLVTFFFKKIIPIETCYKI